MSATCNGNGTGLVTSSFSDPDGATTAVITFTNKNHSVTKNLPNSDYSPKWPIGLRDASVGSWSVKLVVHDKGGSSDRTYTDSSPSCNGPPSGHFTSVKCTGDTFVFEATFSDPNGDTDAYITGQGGTQYGGKKSAPSGTWTQPSSNWVPAHWPAKLWVKDVPNGTYKQVDTIGMPNCTPDVEAQLSCNADGTGKVVITANDPKGTVSVYGAKADGSSPTGKHNAPWTWSPVKVVDTAWSTWTVSIYSNDPGSGGGTYELRVTKSHAPCASVSCNSNLQSGFGGIIPGAPVTFQVTAKITRSKTPPPGANFDIHITGPVNKNYSNVSGTPAQGSTNTWVVTSAPQTFTPDQAGTYTLTWSYYGQDCGGQKADAGYAPFFSVLGGDASAGWGFGAGCSDDTTARIKGWNSDGTPATDYSGAGTDRAAIALGDITGFATAQSNFNGDSPLSAPSQLAFANTTAGGNRYGGGFNLTDSCLPDYQSEGMEGSVTHEGGGLVDLSTMDSGTYVFSSGAITKLSGTVGAGKHITLVVNKHNVYIDGNITYANYNGIDEIPQFELLVKGSIYIKSTVTELHGFYDAQPVNNGGSIFTCATGVNSVGGATYDTCNSPLTFYGAVSAANLYLERSYGNLHAVGSIPAEAAEKVVFTPELWLTGAQSSSDGSGIGGWQSVTSLPPIL